MVLSDTQHNSLFDHLAAAIAVFDARGRVRYLNQPAEALFAVSSSYILGQQLPYWITFDHRTLVQLLHELAEGEIISRRGVALNAADQSAKTIDYVFSTFHDDDEEGLLAVMEMQQVDRQLRITRENQLNSQLLTTRNFVRGLAHEIKNPLGGLRGAAQLLAAELTDPELSEYTDVIIQEADRLQALVDRVLGPNKRPNFTEVSIHQVLERVRSVILADSKNRELKIIRDYDPSIPEIEGDLDQLIQSVMNIVGNAAKALKGDGEIILKSRVVRNFTIGGVLHRLVAQIDIIDNGPGVPPELSDSLFLPMVTSGEGMGLGLSIAQNLVNQHKGLIEFQSEPGKTVFSILLPLDVSLAAEQQEEQRVGT